jgi:hypothetical protein
MEINSRLNQNFGKYVTGYHMFNKQPLKEVRWEEANSDIFKRSGISIYSESDGSHLSGMDLDTSFGKFSNKSSKYSRNKENFDISSYRLTKICNQNNFGTPEEIIEEINKRKNYDKYSILIRDETKDNSKILYDWLIIPSDHAIMNPSSYTWVPKLGRQSGRNRDIQVGWTTNHIEGSNMEITFSMSSQLWIHIKMTDELKKYKIASVEVNKNPEYNYFDIQEILCPSDDSTDSSEEKSNMT